MNSVIKIRDLTIGENQYVRLMAAVNLSEESFYKGSIVHYNEKKELEKNFIKLLDQGAEIIDLGPKSTAPKDIYGRETNISPSEEIKRLEMPLQLLRELSQDILISIDTQSSKVANYAFSKGADIINDISGLHRDPGLGKVIGDNHGFAIVMACKENPGDVFKKNEVITALESSLNLAQKYVDKSHIIIDPGIGGWIPERRPLDDFQLILDAADIREKLNCPILIALSRKSFIGKTLDLPPEKRLNGSLAATAISVLHGADIIRTHDILETKEAIKIAEIFKKLQKSN